MALLATQDITTAGVAITHSSATTGGDTLVAGPRTFLWVKNASGGAITVTINAAVSVVNVAGGGDIAIDNIAVSVPATTGERLIPIPPLTHSAGGIASITYSAVTSLTVAAVRIPQI